MLVLTRKSQQQIQIGDNITITIIQVKGQGVRIGIDAPRETRVLRAELPQKSELEIAGTQAAKPASTKVAPKKRANRYGVPGTSTAAQGNFTKQSPLAPALARRAMTESVGA